MGQKNCKNIRNLKLNIVLQKNHERSVSQKEDSFRLEEKYWDNDWDDISTKKKENPKLHGILFQNEWANPNNKNKRSYQDLMKGNALLDERNENFLRPFHKNEKSKQEELPKSNFYHMIKLENALYRKNMRLSLKFVGIEIDLMVNTKTKESFIDTIMAILKKKNVQINFSTISEIYVLENQQLIEKNECNIIKENSNIFVYDHQNLGFNLSSFLKSSNILYLAPYLCYIGINKKNKLIDWVKSNADLLYTQLSNLAKIEKIQFQPELESILH